MPDAFATAFAVRRRAARADGGFTLIELLVVAGVISVLVGLLLPVLARARRASNEVACLSNLRQWGLAAQMYAISNHGYLPRRGQGVQPTNQVTRPQDWFNALPPTFKLPPYADLVAANTVSRPGGARTVWLCPEAWDTGSTYFWSYGMNMGLSVEQASQNNGMPDKISGVGNTSAMAFMADGPANYGAVFPSMYPGGYNPVARHRNAVNICFLDGHAVACPAAYVGVGTGLPVHADLRWHPPNSTWDSAK